MKAQKMSPQESQERKFEEKVKKKAEKFYYIYIVVFEFLF